MTTFEIVAYQGGRNAEIADLILNIQRGDVGIHVPIEEQPELFDIATAYRDGAFWLAVSDGEVVGTIGMMRYGSSGVLKKLFVKQDYRGPQGAAQALFERQLSGRQRKVSAPSTWTRPPSRPDLIPSTSVADLRSSIGRNCLRATAFQIGTA